MFPTSGAKPGDEILLTKGAGIEGTGIIATDFREELEGKIREEVIERGEKMLDQVAFSKKDRFSQNTLTPCMTRQREG